LNPFIVFLRVLIGNPGPEAQGVTTEVSRNAACPTELGFKKLNWSYIDRLRCDPRHADEDIEAAMTYAGPPQHVFIFAV
jgi:hypothetical protein